MQLNLCHTYFKNRIRKIEQIKDPNLWSHCLGSENPAISLLKNEVLFNGTIWLQEYETFWIQGRKKSYIKVAELKKR